MARFNSKGPWERDRVESKKLKYALFTKFALFGAKSYHHISRPRENVIKTMPWPLRDLGSYILGSLSWLN